MRALWAALAVAVAWQQPTFRTRVDLIRLDVTVVGADGAPLYDLRPDDFVVTIDGTPRPVVFAQNYGAEAARRVSGDEAPVSVATNINRRPGRVVVIVADLDSITLGYEKPIFDTAAAVVERLAPEDAVGLLVLPGRSIELTRDHRKVREVLAALRGTASPQTFRYRLSVSEAEGFRLENQRIIKEVVERECLPSDGTCPIEIRQQVMPTLMEADRRTDTLVGALTALLDRLETVSAPKSVVLLSAGLQRRQASGGRFIELRKRAGRAGASMSIVHMEQPDIDASRKTRGGTVPREELEEGLSAIAGATDATMYYGVGRAAGALERIRSEIVNLYQLGLESQASDGEGRSHKLTVEVKRRGASVRARKELVIGGVQRAPANPVELLAQPVDFTDAPFVVSTYTVRGDEPSTLKVIVGVELADPQAGSQGSYAFAVMSDDKRVFETADHMPADARSAVLAAQIPPGRYRLRAAVVDGAGRRGSLEMPVLIGLRQATGLQLSDLIVGADGERFAPSTRVAAGSPLTAILEVYSQDVTQLEGVAVTMEATRAGSTAAAVRAVADVQTTSLERRRVATARLASAELTPGTWLISAVVRRGSEAVGRVSRAITVESVKAR